MQNIIMATTIFLMFAFVGCAEQTKDTITFGLETSRPVGFKSSLESEPRQSQDYVLVRLDGITPIDGSENEILICTPKKEYCTQTCISVYRPDISRWSVFKTYYLNGGKCVAYALEYSNGITIPKIKYWVGTFIYNQWQVTGHCSFNIASPNFDGRAYFDFVRPNNAPAYYLHSFFDNSANLVSSRRLLSFNPPAMWTYHDSTVTSADITPQLVSGYSCVKETEILSSF